MRYPLILSGYRGWEDDVLWQLVERGTREGWIRYLGYVPDEDLPYLYAAARTFVYPSSMRDSVYLFLKRCLAVCR
jgi:alpha-1,3-rhamnosyl/mannosyltransferase